jgi:hypothetical protein
MPAEKLTFTRNFLAISTGTIPDLLPIIRLPKNLPPSQLLPQGQEWPLGFHRAGIKETCSSPTTNEPLYRLSFQFMYMGIELWAKPYARNLRYFKEHLGEFEEPFGNPKKSRKKIPPPSPSPKEKKLDPS